MRLLRRRLTGTAGYKRARSRVVRAWILITGTLGLDVRRIPRSLARQRTSVLEMSLDYVTARIMLDSPNPSFIYIGAFDGQANDPVFDLVRQHRWSGVLVEPNPKSFAALQQTHADTPGLTFLNVGVAESSGPRPFYTVREGVPGAPYWVQQLASFDKNVVMSHIGQVPGLASNIDTTVVECVTLDELFAVAPDGRADLLQIDAEGYDAAIVGMLRVGPDAPRAVRFEHMHMSAAQHDDCVMKLLRAGYKISVERQDTLAFRE